jgi:hypothetical protein
MRLISLNTWAGTAFEPLVKFIEEHREDTDVFCFQEILFGAMAGQTPVHKARTNLFLELEQRLSGFNVLVYKSPDDARWFQSESLPDGVESGLVIFVRKSIQVIDSGGFRCYRDKLFREGSRGGKITGSCQWVTVQDSAGIDTTILNLHGLWQRDTDKADTPERLVQSEIVREFINHQEGKVVLCGDFNLVPDGESIKILEDGMINLVKKFNVTSVRSDFYTKLGKFASYILTSPNIQVAHFEVLQDQVSDHLPLLLDFN